MAKKKNRSKKSGKDATQKQDSENLQPDEVTPDADETLEEPKESPEQAQETPIDGPQDLTPVSEDLSLDSRDAVLESDSAPDYTQINEAQTPDSPVDGPQATQNPISENTEPTSNDETQEIKEETTPAPVESVDGNTPEEEPLENAEAHSDEVKEEASAEPALAGAASDPGPKKKSSFTGLLLFLIIVGGISSAYFYKFRAKTPVPTQSAQIAPPIVAKLEIPAQEPEEPTISLPADDDSDLPGAHASVEHEESANASSHEGTGGAEQANSKAHEIVEQDIENSDFEETHAEAEAEEAPEDAQETDANDSNVIHISSSSSNETQGDHAADTEHDEVAHEDAGHEEDAESSDHGEVAQDDAEETHSEADVDEHGEETHEDSEVEEHSRSRTIPTTPTPNKTKSRMKMRVTKKTLKQAIMPKSFMTTLKRLTPKATSMNTVRKRMKTLR